MGIPKLHSYRRIGLILLGHLREVPSVKYTVFDLSALILRWWSFVHPRRLRFSLPTAAKVVFLTAFLWCWDCVWGNGEASCVLIQLHVLCLVRPACLPWLPDVEEEGLGATVLRATADLKFGRIFCWAHTGGPVTWRVESPFHLELFHEH